MAHPESWPSLGARSGSKKGPGGGTTAAGETTDGDDEQRDTLELGAAELSRLRELDPADESKADENGADENEAEEAKADEEEDRETVELTGPPPFSSENMSSSPFSSLASGHDVGRQEDATEEDDAEDERVAWHTIPVPPPSDAEDD